MEIRQPSYYKQFAYNPYPSCYHPDSVFLAEYQMKDCKGDIGNISFNSLKRALSMGCTKTETLLKAGYISLLKEAVQNSHKVYRYWNSIKICLRNKYYPLDGSMYLDYLELLEQYNKDVRNPKFICPENLNREHDFYVEKSRRIREREQAERNRLAELEELRQSNYSQEDYERDKAIYFGIHLKRGNISIRVLESIDEFEKEAAIHKHCVFSNKYYAKTNSLILSASVDNVPTETIQLYLNNFQIAQSRGLNNTATQYNSQIRKLINDNLHLFMERSEGIKISV